MKYSVKIVRNNYNEKAIRTSKQVDETFFDSLDTALASYNSSVIGERVYSDLRSMHGSNDYYVSLTVRNGNDRIALETVFIHNGEVQK